MCTQTKKSARTKKNLKICGGIVMYMVYVFCKLFLTKTGINTHTQFLFEIKPPKQKKNIKVATQK